MYPQQPATIPADAVRAYFGYKSRSAFWNFVHAAGLPFIKLNARMVVFDRAALNEWIASRSTTRDIRPF